MLLPGCTLAIDLLWSTPHSDRCRLQYHLLWSDLCQVEIWKSHIHPFFFSCFGHRGRALAVTVPGIGHSVIRGSDFSAIRSMVRRECYCLPAWIKVFLLCQQRWSVDHPNHSCFSKTLPLCPIGLRKLILLWFVCSVTHAIFPVIIPHMKHANSLAIAVITTLRLTPFFSVMV